LQLTPIIQKAVEIVYTVRFDYTQMNPVMMVIKQSNCTILSQEIQLFCQLTIGIPKNRLQEVLGKLEDMNGVELLTDLKKA
jgi:putative IMPACT (imprinted ancient) family translation regulator